MARDRDNPDREFEVQEPKYPILEFDPAKTEVFRPPYSPIEIPEHCILPIFHEVIDDLENRGSLTKVAELKWEIGPHPVYVMEHKNTRIAVANPGVGASFAAAVMEELIALGCRKFIACGSAGRLANSIEEGAILIPDSAIRDEGTSYHYVSPSREIKADIGRAQGQARTIDWEHYSNR